ncbi:MAG TPA: SRPBCC family protein [Longimicrobiaceae bacterium]|nr:SRPBCC family protein [Longimicrobiaceae bacterium]
MSLPPEDAMPLFTPEGERAWVPGWNPVHRHPADGTLVAGGVFVTAAAGEPETVWMVVHHDAQALEVDYARVTPGIRTGIVRVACAPDADGGAVATVTYAMTALSPAGNEMLARFTEEHFAAMMAEWEQAIARHLAD